ncbi:MAG: TorF family putative porin [Mariprofundaceae bacterium]|nr:TorF family putative porin [Mariprofundaceae bacterium]
MKKLPLSLLLSGTMLLGMGAATAAEAQDAGLAVSGDIGIASQYVWRGVTQTNGKTAIQGDLGVGVGDVSASVWFSNAYPSTAPQFGGRDVVEFDWTVDYSSSFGDSGVGYSLGAIGYTYLYDAASNFPEVYMGLSYGPVSLTAYYNLKDSFNKAYLSGDTWVDLSAGGSVGGFDLSGTVSYAKWKKDIVNRPVATSFKSGTSVVTLGGSKDVDLGATTMTPSLTLTLPVASKDTAGNRSIYGATVQNEFVASVNFTY